MIETLQLVSVILLFLSGMGCAWYCGGDLNFPGVLSLFAGGIGCIIQIVVCVEREL